MRTFEHVRKQLRYPGFDYSLQGAYFVTICAYQREKVFGDVAGQEMVLSEIGQSVEKWRRWIPERFPGVRLDEWITMPDHFHGIVWLDVGADQCVGPVGAGVGPVGAGIGPGGSGHGPETVETVGRGGHIGPPLPRVMQWFKTMSTNEFIRIQRRIKPDQVFPKLWQRSYHDRIIRNDRELEEIRMYIQNNPFEWALGEHRGV